MHKLLQRQLKRCFGSLDELPESLRPLLSMIEETYQEADQDRLLLERSLELTSQELLEKNRLLREELLEREKFAEALQQAQTDLRQVIEKSPYGIVVRREESWVFINHAWARFLGYGHPDELLHQRGINFMHPEELERLKQGRLPVGPGGIPIGQVRMLRRDKEVVTLEVSPAQEILFEGRPALLIMAQDITSRKKLEAQLLLSDRMASLGMLAAGVAHEINNPLTYVLGNLQFLSKELSQLPGQNPLSEFVEPIREAEEGAQRVRQIVRDLKTFSRVEGENQKPIDVRVVLENTAKMVWNELRHRARLHKDLRAVPDVLASDARLGQVFLNLLVNAVHALPEGDANNHEIALRTYTNSEGQAVIEVRDSGVGIPEEDLQKIFDPFFTTKPFGVGTGLGLSICHGIITALHGRIEVESSPRKGALFRVVLPPAQPSLQIKEEPTSTLKERAGRVLVIDDEVIIGSVVRRALKEHKVEIVQNAPEALERIKSGERFDVILCDLMMPAMNGVEFYSALSSIAPEQRESVVFMTGGAFTSKAHNFLQEINNVCLEKPFSTKDLKLAIQRRLRYDPDGLQQPPKIG